jgi:hypothetical protein
LTKRTSINSIFKLHKEKEMADFRRWFYALAVVALLAGLAVPVSAQAPPFTCSTSVTVAPVVRAEGYTELVGDLVLNCTGGVPTAIGLPIPQVNFTVFLNTNITSRLVAAGLFNEALLIVDEPNSPVSINTPGGLPHPILNCGNGTTFAADNGPSGPGVCSIRSVFDPTLAVAVGNSPNMTYDGNITSSSDPGNPACTAGAACGNGANYPAILPSVGACGATVPGTGVSAGQAPTRTYPSAYGCGRPNVFQGRIGVLQNPNQFNAVTFLGVPLDPPGTTTSRTIRITNVRANAVAIGVSTTFTTAQIQMNIGVNGPTTMTIANPQQIVAYVNRGLTTEIPTLGTIPTIGGARKRNRLDFVQCIPENPDLHLFSSAPGQPVNPNPNFAIPPYQGFEGANFIGGADFTPLVRFREGFASSWKVRNIAHHTTNATYNVGTNSWTYDVSLGGVGDRGNPFDQAQNVPGAVYNTESGVQFTPTQSVPSPNPPQGFGFQPVTNQGRPFASAAAGGLDTGISGVGVANQGTRLALTLANVPSGASVWVPQVLYLFRQGSAYEGDPFPDPTVPDGDAGVTNTTGLSGVMVLTTLTDPAGSGGFVGGFGASAIAGGTNGILQRAGSLVVYEILYTDPFALELVDVPTVVAYTSNPAQNLPTPGTITTGTGGFAPFYTTTAAGQPTPSTLFGSPTGIPRFTPGTGPLDLFLISKCACNLLFPYVVSAAGYDTGLAIANTSQDPGATFGFFAVPHPGRITMWYYGIMANGDPVPGPQTSTSVPAGRVLTYVASSGSTDWGLDGRAAGFIGYMITQSEFQFCHAFAYIGALGAGPTQAGVSEGYLGIVLDQPGAFRTNQVGENMAH